MSSNQLISPTRNFLGWLLLLWFGRGGHLARAKSAGKGSVPDPSLPSAKEGGIEGREGILGGSPALPMERTTALCSREIHPPVRAGQSLPGPSGEVLRWAKRWWFFHDLELYFRRWSKDI